MSKGGKTVDRVNKTPLTHSCVSAYSRLGNVDLSLRDPAVLFLCVIIAAEKRRSPRIAVLGWAEGEYVLILCYSCAVSCVCVCGMGPWLPSSPPPHPQHVLHG